MRSRIICICILLLITGAMVSTANVDEKEVFQKGFTVTFEVTYNVLTLTEAAEKEREFRERYGDDACSVNVRVKDSSRSSTVNPNQQLHIETSGNVGIGTSTLTQSDIDWQHVTVDSTTLELIQE